VFGGDGVDVEGVEFAEVAEADVARRSDRRHG
jgi:hypothetical protein